MQIREECVSERYNSGSKANSLFNSITTERALDTKQHELDTNR
jgi:hypothetical protein